jgi:hypothetical protein
MWKEFRRQIKQQIKGQDLEQKLDRFGLGTQRGARPRPRSPPPPPKHTHNPVPFASTCSGVLYSPVNYNLWSGHSKYS